MVFNRGTLGFREAGAATFQLLEGELGGGVTNVKGSVGRIAFEADITVGESVRAVGIQIGATLNVPTGRHSMTVDVFTSLFLRVPARHSFHVFYLCNALSGRLIWLRKTNAIIFFSIRHEFLRRSLNHLRIAQLLEAETGGGEVFSFQFSVFGVSSVSIVFSVQLLESRRTGMVSRRA